jgi:hypothetical protein
MSLSAAAGLGLFYLIMRRNKDDWGRDYYRFAAPFLGKWQFVGGIGTLAVLAWLFLSLKGIINLFLPQIFYAGAAGVVCLTAAMLLSLCLWFSENPMRLKGCMLGICLFLYLHCGLILTAVIEALNRYVSGWNIPTFMPEVLRSPILRFQIKNDLAKDGECDAGVLLRYGEEHSTKPLSPSLKPLSFWERGWGEGTKPRRGLGRVPSMGTRARYG